VRFVLRLGQRASGIGSGVRGEVLKHERRPKAALVPECWCYPSVRCAATPCESKPGKTETEHSERAGLRGGGRRRNLERRKAATAAEPVDTHKGGKWIEAKDREVWRARDMAGCRRAARQHVILGRGSTAWRSCFALRTHAPLTRELAPHRL
jgi:hypothetical protein